MAELVRGVIRGFDAGTYTATVEVEGSQQAWVSGVPVSRGIAAGELVAGRWCVVGWTGGHDPVGSMVVGVY